MGYAKKAIEGFGLQTLLKIALYGLSLIKIYFLARILSPDDFGLFSLTAIALGVTEAMTQTGVNLTILQSKHSVKYFLDTAWVISIIRGLAIGIIMILLGLGLAQYFSQPELVMLSATAALIPVIRGFINPYIVALHKEMMFIKDTLYRFSILSIEVIGSVLFALITPTAYALVLGLLTGAIFEVALTFTFLKQRPRFNYSKNRAKLILENAKLLSISSLLNYLTEHLDDLIIGRVTSTYDLGLYHNAYSLTHKVNYQVSKSVHHGIIPVLTKIKDNRPRLRLGFIKSFLSTTAIVLLLSLPIYIFAQQIITFFLGNDWLEAIPLIRPLLVAGVTQSLIAVCYTLFLSQKQYQLVNWHLLLSLILMAGLMSYLGNSQGLLGAVKGLAYARLISAPVVFWLVYATLFKQPKRHKEKKVQ